MKNDIWRAEKIIKRNNIILVINYKNSSCGFHAIQVVYKCVFERIENIRTKHLRSIVGGDQFTLPPPSTLLTRGVRQRDSWFIVKIHTGLRGYIIYSYIDYTARSSTKSDLKTGLWKIIADYTLQGRPSVLLFCLCLMSIKQIHTW